MEDNTQKKKLRLPSTLVTSILWIVFGIILIINPGSSLDFLCRILGAVALVFGVIQAVIGITGGGASGGFGLVVGIILAIVGLVIIVNPDLLVSLLPTVIGVILVIHGAASLINSFGMIGGKDRYWWLGIIFSLLSLGMGALLFFRAREAAEYVARIGGVFLVYSGISHLWLLYRRNKLRRLREQEANAIDVNAEIVDK